MPLSSPWWPEGGRRAGALSTRAAATAVGMDTTMVEQLRQEMERAMARRIHPH